MIKNRTKADRERQRQNVSSSASTNVKKCSFCESADAAVVLETLVPKPLCLLHYYTTRACRMDPRKVRALLPTVNKNSEHGKALEQQHQHIQTLFATAFTELQRDITEESARVLLSNKDDPLSILDVNVVAPKQRVKQSKAWTSMNKSLGMNLNDQKQQQQLEEEEGGGYMPAMGETERHLIAQSMKSSQFNDSVNPFKRRKFPKRSIWNLAMESKQTVDKAPLTHDSCDGKCTCGSENVLSDGNRTLRNDAVSKAEIWGTKGASEVISRYRCLDCGQIWYRDV